MAIFNYDPTLSTHRDWIRLLVGDVREANPELDDFEIDALLTDEEEPEPILEGEDVTTEQWRSYRYTVASRAAEIIAGKHAVDSDVSFENQRVGLSSKFTQYTKLAKRLKDQARSTGGGWVKTERW